MGTLSKARIHNPAPDLVKMGCADYLVIHLHANVSPCSFHDAFEIDLRNYTLIIIDILRSLQHQAAQCRDFLRDVVV